MLATDMGHTKGKQIAYSFLVQTLGKEYLYQHPNFQHFDKNTLNCKYCKNVSSISFIETIFAHRMPYAKPETSEVISWLTPRGFECSFKVEAVVNSTSDHRGEAQGLPLLLGCVAAAPAQLLPAKHAFSLQRSTKQSGGVCSMSSQSQADFKAARREQ